MINTFGGGWFDENWNPQTAGQLVGEHTQPLIVSHDGKPIGDTDDDLSLALSARAHPRKRRWHSGGSGVAAGRSTITISEGPNLGASRGRYVALAVAEGFEPSKAFALHVFEIC